MAHGECNGECTSASAEYRAWGAAKQRCFNPKNHAFKYYGGRGITMCPQWRNSFWKFYQHMGPKPSPQHSLDRYPDMNGHYEPGNVRWATWSEQGKNRRIPGGWIATNMARRAAKLAAKAAQP